MRGRAKTWLLRSKSLYKFTKNSWFWTVPFWTSTHEPPFHWLPSHVVDSSHENKLRKRENILSPPKKSHLILSTPHFPVVAWEIKWNHKNPAAIFNQVCQKGSLSSHFARFHQPISNHAIHARESALAHQQLCLWVILV